MGHYRNKEDKNEYQRKWYSEHKETHRGYIDSWREKNKKWFKEYKSSLVCSKCGESHSSCLDFHHRNPSEKEINVGDIWKKDWGARRILSEIEKCDVLCSNCHRKIHDAG